VQQVATAAGLQVLHAPRSRTNGTESGATLPEPTSQFHKRHHQ
jgi:hypothetical protein